MPTARSAVAGFSPLDDELGLLPGHLTPSLFESVVRLGTWMPFLPAAKMVAAFTRVDLSKPTARRLTEGAGQAYVEVQAAQVATIERDLPASPAGPAIQQMSVDGAMVPLVHKEWTEVKTLAIGTVGAPSGAKGEIRTMDLSYFSRLADAATFTRLATVETHRRGTEKAGRVCAIVDGAEWAQTFIDMQCPEAVRIPDWGHAAEYVVAAAQAILGAGTAATSDWLSVQLQELRHGDPDTVLEAVRSLPQAVPEDALSEEARAVVAGSLAYLEKRREQIRYAEFAAQGYPIGSGAVESANKLVVEARMKGAGMHWEREYVDPMLALRTIACSDRWEEDWPLIVDRLREQVRERAAARRSERSACGEKRADAVTEEVAGTVEALEPIAVEGEAERDLVQEPQTLPVPHKRLGAGPRRPAADHPWRHMPIGRAAWRQQPAVPAER
ncbi:MAG: ISKra4 family transposase [Chloroflexota bacterium]|nr:MAG: ISKra4 family transposase [Chloroflexota bacterium]